MVHRAGTHRTNATISCPLLVRRFLAFDGSPHNRHSVEVVTLWGHQTSLWRSLPDAFGGTPPQ